jgi:hypothetical protein
LYYQNDDHTDDELSLSSAESLIESSIKSSIESSIESSVESTVESQGNLTIDSIVLTEPAKRGRGRLRKYLASAANFIFNTTDAINLVSPFIASRQKEIAGLLKKGVFIPVNKGDLSADVRIFSSRFVDEIKHSEIEKTFEKSRLMIQACVTKRFTNLR